MKPDDIIYLDYAAATPLSDAALAAMQPYFSQRFYNPSSLYAPAVQVRRDYEAAKHHIAMAIGARADDCIITAGATESINLALSAARGGHVVTTAIEHHAVLCAARRYPHTTVPVGSSGIVSPDVVAAAIQPSTRVISAALANNELGTIQPLRRLAAIVKTERQRRRAAGESTPLWLHCDGSQGIGQIDVNVARLGVDMLTINAGKCYGPKQVGLLWRQSDVVLQPQIVGGGQEQGMRSGTENVAGVIGFAAALDEAVRQRASEASRLRDLRDLLQTQLQSKCKQLTITITKKRLPGSLHVYVAGVDAERLIYRLETCGVLLATGSACAARSASRSHVLTAIGLADEAIDGSLRLTLGRCTSRPDVERAAELIAQAINDELARSAS
ncbi:aminotransferase [Candidatus Saccharibacteria bacterium]|nr:MAG: aminotransferase [Candidatus Saccharibacteria bacterium]